MRTLATFLIASSFLIGVEQAHGDGLPPPPPKGLKFAPIDHEVILGKDVSGYVFVEALTTFRQGSKYRKLELTDMKATALTVPDRRSGVSVFAVPEKTAATFKTDEELFTALSNGKVEWCHQTRLRATATLKDTDKRDRVKWTHTIQAIDPVKGPTVKIEGDGQNAKGENLGANGIESRYLIAALAFSFAVAFAGLWLARRK